MGGLKTSLASLKEDGKHRGHLRDISTCSSKSLPSLKQKKQSSDDKKVGWNKEKEAINVGQGTGRKFICPDISQISSAVYVLPEKVVFILDTDRKHRLQKNRILSFGFQHKKFPEIKKNCRFLKF